ncbi:ATP-dependent bile acid permease [Venturia nashicola]|uniref:ATP-dependent bile acid permease n=1 Tax=Venturia nashicola TaxID=86259 RepID=A0A4Z1NXL5_9PEZI|nr:ATP-dependent bile acid permease [Venturia nashicola]TLD32351.1 ATP-dependent bile acid permease [Venturia nashicola]
MAPRVDAAHPPLSVIATWPFNFTNPPETRGWGIIFLFVLLLVLSYIVVSLRIWARLRKSKNPGIDDALIVFNMIPLTGLAIALCLGFSRYGFDRHVWNSPLPKLEKARQILMSIELLYLVSTSTTKISILLFYRRLARGTISSTFMYAVWAAIASVVIYFLYFFIALLFTCNPLEAFWKQIDPAWSAQHKGKFQCHGEAANLIASAAVSVIHDFVACGLPTLLLWKLQISRIQKLALGGLFALGLFVCLAGVLRLAAIPYVYFNTYDTTWDSLQALLWLAVEAHITVICASAPALKAYFKGAPAVSRYSPWPSDYSFSRYRSSASSRKFLQEKKPVPVVTDEKLLGSYFNTTGGDQGGRVWFQGTEAGGIKTYENRKFSPRLDLDKSLPRPPSYASFDDDVYQGREPGFGYQVTIQGGRAF